MTPLPAGFENLPLDIVHATQMPPAPEGQTIGLFGGSFNPPHAGHVHVSEMALNRLGLDRIWWLVTPGNPLKDTSELAPLSDRIRACQAMNRDRRVTITAFEARHRTRFTADTIALVKRYRPRAKFVWIMGADNLAGFHRWQNWQEIAGMLPIAVIDRPGSTLSYLSSQAAIAFSRHRLDEADASRLAYSKPPRWTFIHGPRNSLSSTKLRRAAKAGKQCK